MLSARRGSIARRLERLIDLARQKVDYRQHVRENAAALRALRVAIDRAGIDPANNAGMRYFARAEQGLAQLGDTAEVQRADAEFIAADPMLRARRSLAADGTLRAASFAGRPPPDPGASPVDWYAWSLAATEKSLSAKPPP